MGMFTACFDASGQEKEHPYMVVVGFISSVDEWIKLSEAWIALWCDLLTIIKGATFQKFGCGDVGLKLVIGHQESHELQKHDGD